jgi:hypothetical protein
LHIIIYKIHWFNTFFLYFRRDFWNLLKEYKLRCFSTEELEIVWQNMSGLCIEEGRAASKSHR